LKSFTDQLDQRKEITRSFLLPLLCHIIHIILIFKSTPPPPPLDHQMVKCFQGSNNTAAVTIFAVESDATNGVKHTIVFLTAFESASFESDTNVTVVVELCGGGSSGGGGGERAASASSKALLPATARLRRIDATHANPKQVWVDAGSPKDPNATLLAELQKASELVDEQVVLVPSATGGCSTATVVLPSIGASVAVIDFNTSSFGVDKGTSN
jgi:hypothetical protein